MVPIYFNYFPAIMPTELIDVLLAAEYSFNLINYSQHQDDITALFNDCPDLSSKDLSDNTLLLYREHINSVLALQGILLANPYTDRLIPLCTILHCVSVLATQPLSAVLEGDSVEIEDCADSYFARVLSIMSGLSVPELLGYITSVTPDIITYLHQDKPLIALLTTVELLGEQRFRNSPLEKKGVVVEAIRLLGKFGYDIESFMLTHAEMIAAGTIWDTAIDADTETKASVTDIANEIILMVLGSNTQTNVLLAQMLDVSEHIVDTSSDLLKVNTLIMKYMEQHNA